MSGQLEEQPIIPTTLETVQPDAIINSDGSIAWEKRRPIILRDIEYNGKQTWGIDVTELDERVSQWTRHKFSHFLGTVGLRQQSKS